jgi:uncharacterized protein
MFEAWVNLDEFQEGTSSEFEAEQLFRKRANGIRQGASSLCCEIASRDSGTSCRLLATPFDCVHGPPPQSKPSITAEECPPMSFSMSQASLPAIEMSLNALSAVLDKGAAFAAAKKIDPSVLLTWRLAPDMFALTKQVQVATDLAKNGVARLGGVEPPRFEDNETTIEQLKARIAKALAFIKTVDPKQIDAALDREITFPLGPTNKGQMKGVDYLNHFVLPNVYFHCSAAYAILRHCGVEIGKADFLGAIPLKMI